MQTLDVVLDRIEDDHGVLKFEGGQELLWPAEELPNDAIEGSVLKISLQTEEEASMNERERSQSILNEIFNPEEDE